MLPIGSTAVVVLASGLSARYPGGDKLVAEFAGKPLVEHVAELAGQFPFAFRFAVVGSTRSELARILRRHGFRLILNPDPSAGRECSLRLGLSTAILEDPAAVLVLLGDMPLVTREHIKHLHQASDHHRATVSSTGHARMPPVLFPAKLVRAALAENETPIRNSVSDAVEVRAEPASLWDFDTPEDFARTHR